MTHTVWIPPHHRDLTGGLEHVAASGATVGAVLDDIETHYPGMRSRLAGEGRLRPGIAVAVDGVVATDGLRRRLAQGSEIHFIPAIAGG